ncbi:MAG: hypothetical protein IJ853_00275 [Rickettsiales bacterium]|nr:hypothetical protein [Rickettsiales bacterium]
MFRNFNNNNQVRRLIVDEVDMQSQISNADPEDVEQNQDAQLVFLQQTERAINDFNDILKQQMLRDFL